MSGGTTISTSETKVEALNLQSSAYGVTIPVVYGVNRIAGNMLWYGDFKATAHTDVKTTGGKGGGGGGVTTETTTYTYSASVVLGLCEGPVSASMLLWRGKKYYVGGPPDIGASVATGALAQAVWPYLSTTFSGQALGYSGVAYMYAQDYQLGASAQVENHNFQITGIGAFAYGVADANPPDVLLDLLTNTRYGAGFPAAQLPAMTNWSNYCRAAGLLLSPALTTQMPAAEFVARLCRFSNTAVLWTTGGLKFLPYGDTALTNLGATYTPNLTPLFDLTDDDFTPNEGDDPIKVTRKPQADAFNSVRLDFNNRANSYNGDVAEAKDSASIDAFGPRPLPVIKADWICDPWVARQVAQLVLQREQFVRNTYAFSLPWTRVMLEPMDLVTLTDSYLGYNKLVVRITAVTEDAEGNLSVLAEDFPQGIAHAAAYTSQAGVGFQHNYNADPGSVAAPMFFEAPIERTTTGLEVYAAIRGPSANWGGCRVWTSLDGNNYKDSGLIHGGARFGTITGPVSAGNLPVAIAASQLISGSASDSAQLATLCYVGGANPEYLAYTTATLTSALNYTLAGLTRGAYGSNPSLASHTAGEPFARVDDAIAKSGSLDLGLIGQTLYFKFTSFNIYGAAEQSLASATAYPYLIVGSMANLPPPPFDNYLILCQPDGTRQHNFSYNNAAPVDWKGAVIRYMSGTVPSPAWETMTPLQDNFTHYTASPVEVNAPLAGVYTFACRSIDKVGAGNLSTMQVRTITLPNHRLGTVYSEYFENTEGWLGVKTGCSVYNGYLDAVDSTTWGTAPADFASYSRWNLAPTSPIFYETPARDLGVVVSGSINSNLDADGTTVQELATSANGTTWSGWSTATAPFVSRYIKLRLTVTATGAMPVPAVRLWSWSVNAAVKEEYIDNLVPSALTGVYRIGVGDIRVPYTKPFLILKNIQTTIQDNRNGWTVNRVDNNLTPGPRYQFALAGVLTDPAFVDFNVRGLL
jgi:hypothetical protein